MVEMIYGKIYELQEINNRRNNEKAKDNRVPEKKLPSTSECVELLKSENVTSGRWMIQVTSWMWGY